MHTLVRSETFTWREAAELADMFEHTSHEWTARVTGVEMRHIESVQLPPELAYLTGRELPTVEGGVYLTEEYGLAEPEEDDCGPRVLGKVGTFTRELVDREAIYHGGLYLTEEYQRRGFATWWLARCFDAYRAAGIRTVLVGAIPDSPAGGKAWAAYGFTWYDPLEAGQTLTGEVREHPAQFSDPQAVARAAEAMARGGGPTPRELAAIEPEAVSRFRWAGRIDL